MTTMKRFGLHKLYLLSAGCLCVWLLGCTGRVLAVSAQFQADCLALTRNAHRLTGTPEYAAAAHYVTQRLRGMGARVIVEKFPAPVLVTTRCQLTFASGRMLPLEPGRANGIIPPVTPREGITGELLDAGSGTLAEYGTRSPLGKIVVLNYNSDMGWLRAFRLGARAVIFARGDDAAIAESHATEADVNFPRYYYAGSRHDLREGATVTLQCEEHWEAGVGQNVIAFFPGTHPKFTLGTKEAVVIATNLDTYGEVPTRTPGARGAATCASLLQIAAALRQTPPRRDVVVAFFDGQAHGHLGASAFYRAIDKDATISLATRASSYAAEAKMCQSWQAGLKNLAALSTSSDTGVRLITRLKDVAAQRVSDINTILQEYNTASAKVTGGPSPYLVKLQAQIKPLTEEKARWNILRRYFSQRKIAPTLRLAPRELRLARDQVRDDVSKRQAQLALMRECLAGDQAIAGLLGDSLISLHLSLILGDTTSRWGVVLGGDSPFHSAVDLPGLYGQFLNAFKSAATDSSLTHFEMATVVGGGNPRAFFPAPLVHSGEIAGRVGVSEMTLATMQERLASEGTPDDTLSRLNLPYFETQGREIAIVLGKVINAERLSQRATFQADKLYYAPHCTDAGAIVGPTVVGTSLGSSVPNQLMPNAVVRLRIASPGNVDYESNKIPAFDPAQIDITDGNAAYAFGPVPQAIGVCLVFAATFDARGEVTAVSTFGSASTAATRINLFRCAEVSTKDGATHRVSRYGAIVLTNMIDSVAPSILDGIANSGLDPNTSYFKTLDGVAYWYCEQRIDDIKIFGAQAVVGLMNGHGETTVHATKNPFGVGWSFNMPWQFPESAVTSSADLWRLDESRLDILRTHGVCNSSIEELHGRSEDFINGALTAKSPLEREALANSAFSGERPVYETARQSLDDLIHAVLILLALAIPFSFALERLLIGSTNIYRQIGWFCLFFIATFFVLYLVHPAFAISNQPLIIFLAFSLMLLSGLVIGVVMQKFEEQLKVLRGQQSAVHTADVSRVSTMMAAMSMGISTMRRRPLRTFLTALTITLMTFTILNFASFDTQLGVVKLAGGAPKDYLGVFLHQTSWSQLNPELPEMLEGRWHQQAVITHRYWLPAATDLNGVNSLLLSRDDGSTPFVLKGVVGLDAAELPFRADLRALLGKSPADFSHAIFLSQSLAQSLHLTVGMHVLLKGVNLRVAGILPNAATVRVKDMDGNSILPVDFAAMTSSQSAGSTTTAAQQLQNQPAGASVLANAQRKLDWVVLPEYSVAIVASETARAIGGTLRGITVYPKDQKDAAAVSLMAEDMARVLPLPVVATRPDGIYTHVLAPTVEAKGMKDLIFPLLLGGLIIFGTMLGSVADREKEIYTFSALGLAPTHVATLFFSEAMIYSFIGGLGGYLLAQTVMKILTFLASYGWVAVPEINYSSTNAIVTIVIVMTTVLLSAVYPAIKASRSANPGILRSWRLPAPVDDRFDIVFPFTVSPYDFTGVVSFLKEHFDAFSDTGLGTFMARNTQIFGKGATLGFRADLALAPFDLGVTELFEIQSVPSEIAGIDEVKVVITRNSGQRKDWERLNKVLLDDLRRQFLLWRALAQDTMETYRYRTITAIGEHETMAETTEQSAVVTPQLQ